MTDGQLLGMGCVVSFIALAGAYVYIRESYESHAREEPAEETKLREVS